MTTKIFTPDEIKDLKVAALARKYKCSDDYVRRVLKGDRERNTELAQSIMQDSLDMLAIGYSDKIVPLNPVQNGPL